MIPIIDTHLHLVYPDRFKYPWLQGAPAINKPWAIENYWAEAKPLGIISALHMEVDVSPEDALAESEFVSSVQGIVGVIAAARPEHGDFVRQLDALSKVPGLRGIRRILHEAPDDLSQSAMFAKNIRRLAERGLSFDLCVRADQLAIGRQLAEKAQEVSFILDHCGVPDVTGQGLDPWRDEIRAIAKLENVSAKISGIVAYSGADWTTDTIRPYVEHVIECFGWDRVVWGSDHPVVTLTGSLTRWVAATREIIAFASNDQQTALLSGNAKRIYRL